VREGGRPWTGSAAASLEDSAVIPIPPLKSHADRAHHRCRSPAQRALVVAFDVQAGSADMAIVSGAHRVLARDVR
jgi:hypothetical protein